MKTHPTDENWYKYDPIFQLYRSTRPLLGHSTCPSARTTTRQLSKPEFHLWTTITIRVEMTPLMIESRSDYQHTRILTHSNSTTTTIWEQTPDFVLQQPQKIGIVNSTGWVLFSNTAMLVKTPPKSENVSIIENDHISTLTKRASIVFVSDRKWEAMSEREIGKGEMPFWVVRVLFMLSQRFCILKFANGIMLQIVLCL